MREGTNVRAVAAGTSLPSPDMYLTNRTNARDTHCPYSRNNRSIMAYSTKTIFGPHSQRSTDESTPVSYRCMDTHAHSFTNTMIWTLMK